MPELWTSEVVAEMHLHRIKQKELAEALGWTAEYVNMVLNGKRNPKSAEDVVKKAIQKLIDEERDDCFDR